MPLSTYCIGILHEALTALYWNIPKERGSRTKRSESTMSNPEPIDFIDLTQDSPANKALRLRTRNFENDAVPVAQRVRRRPRKRDLRENFGLYVRKLQKTQYSAKDLRVGRLVFEVPITKRNLSLYRAAPSEVIDLESSNVTEARGMDNRNQSVQETNGIAALTCPICLDRLSSDNKPTSTKCGHVFCGDCLKLAVQKFKKCPSCQTPVKLVSCTRLYI